MEPLAQNDESTEANLRKIEWKRREILKNFMRDMAALDRREDVLRGKAGAPIRRENFRRI